MPLFDIISLLYAFLGVRALWTLAKNWRAFTDAELTAFDRRLASDIAFFVFIPIGVFLHELGHALATLQVGGQVVEFHYALFYGYVVPRGNFTPLQEWWIALSGNLVSVLFGFVP
ncbi:MAG: M50 family metallopeptidase, partial [Anaerolineales bacterium]|nr:M50 family metallopeptidase [Anaerolineales bacterium]